MRIIALILILLFPIICAEAQEPTTTPTVTPTVTPSSTPVNSRCRNLVRLKKFRDGGILYKPINVHGARGATLIVQNFKYWYGSRKKNVYDVNCKKRIGVLGFWSRGWPYGERYYGKPYGSGDSGQSLARKAKKAAGSSGGIIIITRRFGVRINNFAEREGFVRSP